MLHWCFFGSFMVCFRGMHYSVFFIYQSWSSPTNDAIFRHCYKKRQNKISNWILFLFMRRPSWQPLVLDHSLSFTYFFLEFLGHKMPYYEKILRDYNFYDIKTLDKMYGVNINLPSNSIDRLSNIGTFNALRFVSAIKETNPEKYETTWRKLFQRLWTENKEIYRRQDFEEVC